VLLADEASSTLVFAELKWIRKPCRTLEQIERDKEIAKGITQLQLIRAFARGNPNFLCERGKLPREITSYANVHYLLLVWDHWFWIDPEDSIAVVSLDALVLGVKKNANLRSLVVDLLAYEWLPVEGRDFHVSYAPTSVNGAAIESPIFSPAI
jgi:hypothetical protein